MNFSAMLIGLNFIYPWWFDGVRVEHSVSILMDSAYGTLPCQCLDDGKWWYCFLLQQAFYTFCIIMWFVHLLCVIPTIVSWPMINNLGGMQACRFCYVLYLWNIWELSPFFKLSCLELLCAWSELEWLWSICVTDWQILFVITTVHG